LIQTPPETASGGFTKKDQSVLEIQRLTFNNGRLFDFAVYGNQAVSP